MIQVVNCRLPQEVRFTIVYIYKCSINKVFITPLVFTTTGGMGKECLRYHSRLAELVAIKKGEDYATTMSWIRARTSFALLRSALTCLRGSRARKIMYDIKNIDFNIENAESAISQTF